ncbi:hypothetical protein DHW03_02185 [Pedobacter yonginense]|uniref:Fibronectin type-III domain-containing protein n=1 Tax=Pedobacter yonginense TaxID=651869 RepID=A0A317ERD0_9SPHI|nr:fibronectin type III domain-containing protein [Pedobacter yonginense]PWS28677.1 hypothetical protein DHW03_02185 [Pedobacter yonginense]
MKKTPLKHFFFWSRFGVFLLEKISDTQVSTSRFGCNCISAILLLIALTFGFASRTTAQQVSPVLANTQVNPPYSSYLSDYAASGSTKLQVNLFLKDLTKTNYACRLRIKIEGFGITIQSKNDFSVPAILLNGGELSVISGADLEPYLNPQNLVFQGLSQSEFARSGGKLPEGIYRFTVEVIDYYRKSLVSNSALSVVSIFLAYPPIINQPLNQSKVNPLDPQNVVFQWTPRSTGSINSAYNIAYKFRLVEIVPANRDPNDAIRTSKPLYETYTDQTVLVYGLTEPPLTPGNSYAVQVQAVEAEGRDLFINNGNSEVVKFTYGDKCASPTNILAELSGMTSIRVSWNADPLQQAFSIRYRELNKPGAQWFEQEVLTPSYLIQGLRSSTKYEFQVKAQCSYGYGDYSELQTFDVPDETLSKGDFVCGKVETLSAEEKGEPLPALSRNMIFFAGKFPVVVTEASGSNGKFSGTGTVGVPFLNALSFKVEFRDIRVNINLKLTDGKVVFARQTLEESIDQVIASITVKPDADGNVDAVSAKGLPTIVDAAMVWPGPLPVYDAKAKTVKFSASVDGGTPKEITIKLKEGQPPLVFQDKNDETFSVDKDGAVKHLGKIPPKELLAGGSSTSYAVNTDKARVDFLAPNQKYGLDAYQPELGGNASYASSYQTLSDEGKGKPKYYVSQKSVESQQAEEIQAKITITDKNLSADRLEFKTASGEKLSATQKDGIYTINIIGALPNNDKEIYAYHPDAAKGGANIGKLNISAFGKISKKVVLVPVNGNGRLLSASSTQQRLNRIYSQAVVEWQVEVAESFDAQNTAFNDLETANSNVMSAYTDGQKALIKAYRQSHKLENGTYYIFLVNSLSDGSAGYMVRGGQVGFVATSKGDLERTVAHELGHGAFMLQHTWDNPGFKQGQTQNLMDYNGGTELWYSQWKYMRNPDLIFRPFEGDDEGAYETDGHYSTVYLVSLMLGMSKDKAKELATATEAPDTRVHSSLDYDLNQTWIYPIVQQQTHSLTGGFHGVEEFITALKILYTPNGNVKEIGELLHRYGDTYAHTKFDNIKPNDIDSYELKDADSTVVNLAIDSWKGKGALGIAKRVEPWIQYFNYYTKKYGLQFLTDESLQKRHLHNKTIEQVMRDVYLIKPTDKFRMYGRDFFTFNHFISDGGYPDLIYMRPDWYLSYVKNLSWIIAKKYNLDESKLDLNVFNKMIDFAKSERASLKGIIDYEIAKKLGAQEVYIPIFYAKSYMLIAMADAKWLTDYSAIAKKALALTQKYILMDGRKDVVGSLEVSIKMKNNRSDSFKTNGFKISFK